MTSQQPIGRRQRWIYSSSSVNCQQTNNFQSERTFHCNTLDTPTDISETFHLICKYKEILTTFPPKKQLFIVSQGHFSECESRRVKQTSTRFYENTLDLSRQLQEISISGHWQQLIEFPPDKDTDLVKVPEHYVSIYFKGTRLQWETHHCRHSMKKWSLK